MLLFSFIELKFLRIILGFIFFLGVTGPFLYCESAKVLYQYQSGTSQLSDLRSDRGVDMPYVLPIRYRDVNAVQAVLSQLYPDLRFAVESSSRSLSFIASPVDFKAIRAVIQRLERQLEQIQIHVKIVEMNSADFSEYDHLFFLKPCFL